MAVIGLLNNSDHLLERELLNLNWDDVMTAPICLDLLAARLLQRIGDHGWKIKGPQTIRNWGTPGLRKPRNPRNNRR